MCYIKIPEFNSTSKEGVNDFAPEFNYILPALILKCKKNQCGNTCTKLNRLR